MRHPLSIATEAPKPSNGGHEWVKPIGAMLPWCLRGFSRGGLIWAPHDVERRVPLGHLIVVEISDVFRNFSLPDCIKQTEATNLG